LKMPYRLLYPALEGCAYIHGPDAYDMYIHRVIHAKPGMHFKSIQHGNSQKIQEFLHKY
jgi:hypothetical protein